MPAAPVGAVVSIFYDARRDVTAGDAIVTASGRVYEVASVRRQQRGKHVGRWHLHCLVVVAKGATDIPYRRVHPLRWYRRSRPIRYAPHR